MSLSYDTVTVADGTHRRQPAGIDRAYDIASSNSSTHRRPKHCGCPPCQLGLPHVRRRENAAVLGAEAV